MNKKGLSRPGALQMIASVIIMIITAIGPLYLAATRPNNEWFMVLNGLPALAVVIASIAVLFLYLIGFLRYCGSKGYSKWIGFWLLFAHAFGFIVLMLLPDLKTRQQS
jgi:ABC-type Na+ efflux pump permease subunit